MWIRIIIGTTILALLAIQDLLKNGQQATRWREYAYLILCVAVAIAYGIANDQITARISWEYFYYGKNLAPILGPPPPYLLAVYIQALRIGASATWWFGLVAGAAILIANNPQAGLPRLSYPSLCGRLPSLVSIVALFAVVGGIAGYFYLLIWIDADFPDLIKYDLWRPRRFMTVYGIHLGGYVGGVVAVSYNVWKIRRSRRKAAIILTEPIDTTSS